MSIRRELKEIITVGELRKYIEALPDDMPVCRLTNGYYKVHRNSDVTAFVGSIHLGDDKKTTNALLLSTCC